MRAWVTYLSLTSLEDFLMWELDTLQYDAITVCFPSRDPTQLIPWFLSNPTPLGISSCSGSTSTIWFRIPISVSSDATDHALEPYNFLHTAFHQFMSWKLNEITTSSPSPPPSVTADRILTYGTLLDVLW